MKKKTLATQLGRFILKNYRIPRIYHYPNYDRILINKRTKKPVKSEVHSLDDFKAWFKINHNTRMWNKVNARVSKGDTKIRKSKHTHNKKSNRTKNNSHAKK